MARRAGFTLIELLAVILILGILTTLLIATLGGAEDTVRAQSTRTRLASLQTALEDYFNAFGDYPPSTFSAEQGVANDGTNVGAESLVVALWSRKWDAGGHLADLSEELVNLDQDSSSTTLTDFASRELFEIPDEWGNPIAYLHHRDYDGPGQAYTTLDPRTGAEEHAQVHAARNDRLGRFYQHTSFQLVSAGPDGLFGTEDDLANFER